MFWAEIPQSMFWAEIWKLSDFFLSENSQFLEVKFSIYLNRRVFVMCYYVHRRILIDIWQCNYLILKMKRSKHIIQLLLFASLSVSVVFTLFCSQESEAQRTHNVKTTSIKRWFNALTLNQRWIDVVSTLSGTTLIQRWFNVLTLNQHWIDAISTLCACWEYSLPNLSFAGKVCCRLFIDSQSK